MREVTRTHDILACDPGTGTGWACYNPVTESFTADETQGWLDACEYFDYLTSTGAVPAYFVCERFDINLQTVKTKIVKHSLWIEGYLQVQCDKLGWPFEFQGRERRMWATDEKLKAIGWYNPSPDKHMIDAARHLLVFMIDNKLPGHRDLLQRIASAT